MSDELKTWLDDKTYLMNILSDMGADVVEVVRCKDCKYRYLSGVGKRYYVCDFLDAELKENGYCNYGERGNDETD